jgi:hypothetical protein
LVQDQNHKGDYFQWLNGNKVFLNQIKFKTDTLVACGFLVGAHPRHFRRDKAEHEIKLKLQLGDDLPFQLSARVISAPMEPSRQDKFAFQAIVIETAMMHARMLREAFFALPNPPRRRPVTHTQDNINLFLYLSPKNGQL